MEDYKVVSLTKMGLHRRAIKNFPRVDYATLATTKSLRRKWIASVVLLGDDWLLLKKVQRKTP